LAESRPRPRSVSGRGEKRRLAVLDRGGVSPVVPRYDGLHGGRRHHGRTGCDECDRIHCPSLSGIFRRAGRFESAAPANLPFCICRWFRDSGEGFTGKQRNVSLPDVRGSPFGSRERGTRTRWKVGVALYSTTDSSAMHPPTKPSFTRERSRARWMILSPT
jgi:hypothetical protein